MCIPSKQIAHGMLAFQTQISSEFENEKNDFRRLCCEESGSLQK